MEQVTEQTIDYREIENDTRERIGKRFQSGYQILFEVEKLRSAAETADYEAALEYVKTNERTALIEVVMQGMLSVTNQICGEPLNEMYERALQTDVDVFERERRRIEQEDELMMTDRFKNHTWENKLFLSPYPEEVPPELAANYGYNPVEKGMMIRAFETNDKGKRTTFQLAVANSCVPVLGKFMEVLELGIDDLSSVELMKRSEKLNFRGESGAELVVRAARIYDALLQMNDEAGRLFFLGAPVADTRQQTYEAIIKNYSMLEGEIEKYVEYLVRFDEKIAKILNGDNFSGVEGPISDLVDGEGVQLSVPDRLCLINVLTDRKLNEQAAAILKEIELMRVWSLASMCIRGTKSEKIFRKERVKEITEHAGDLVNNPDELWQKVDRAIAESRPVFYACGGGFMPKFGLFQETAFGGLTAMLGGTASELYTWVCDKCGHVNDINVPLGIFKERCDGCGVSGKCG
jgi:hypothetical protein